MNAAIGIDPGKTGGVVVLRQDRVPVYSSTGEAWQVRTGKGRSTENDPEQMAEVADQARRAVLRIGAQSGIVVIESQFSRPQEGHRSIFTTAEGYGMWRGILAAHRAPVEAPRPQTWQAALYAGVPGQGKERSIAVCQAEIPALVLASNSGKPDLGLADAGCLALYGLLRLEGRL